MNLKDKISNDGFCESDYIQGAIEEAMQDPWGLWAIVFRGRHSFNLSGDELEKFVHRYVLALLKAGASPVVPDRDAKHGFSLETKYGSDPEKVARALVDEWLSLQRDPDFGDVWFAGPWVWEQ